MPSFTRTDDTLVIRTRQKSSGRVFTIEMEQKPYSVEDVQQIVDTFADDRDDVLSVWRVETNDAGMPLTVEDISGLFDLRTAEEIEEASYAAREVAFDGHNHLARLQRHYGTLNHAQQGIGR